MLNLIIFGSPGAGKGTQAALLATEYKLTHLSSGEILRKELKNGRLGARIKKYQEAGKLVPDKLITEMIEKAAAKKFKGHGFIFDGYPRNLRQAKALDKFLKTNKTSLALVLNLELSEREAARRIIIRGKEYGRTDDNRQTMKNRFRVYRTQTTPILNYYRRQKKVINIDGRPGIKMIFKQIRSVVSKIEK